jgi:hypothetical protein
MASKSHRHSQSSFLIPDVLIYNISVIRSSFLCLSMHSTLAEFGFSAGDCGSALRFFCWALHTSRLVWPSPLSSSSTVTSPPLHQRPTWYAIESDHLCSILTNWHQGLLYAAFAVGTTTDVGIAFIMCWLLAKSRTGYARTDGVVSMIMLYTINTGTLIA